MKNNRYFELYEKYKRDVNFVFDEESNGLTGVDLREGKIYNFEEPVRYTVDKLDSYIDSYDILPTIGGILVSEKLKKQFNDLSNKDLSFFPSIIYDEKGNSNNNFYFVSILNIVSCMDIEKSVIEKTRYGTTKIKKLIFKPNCLGEHLIVRMKEHDSYIIVSEEFKKRCEDSKLKGVEFIEEGDSIYTNI
ncbi:imm11 family protein [Ulvibacter litoralis]|uniref:Immunity MXAN-0049 protein domain-containing protein n=1 Tax=Ulvibacter litoralis TaxID=227084 RepID=A0A1G7HEH2_9FLAO|nr:DUF1629 domain-containing protein [Ulvibacter litoralis]GHC57509.1 hypothetical protein GCM10008083_22590 [Ulvibacter litoralis]SDE98778.1 hypothetical protein SAMN05421855_10445 [Ulvibacter litoralis]